MQTSDLDYVLPTELIAQRPCEPRDAARLLVLDVASGRIEHHRVADLPLGLSPSLWVGNDTRVVAARLPLRKPTGGQAQLLLLEALPGDPADPAGACWRAMAQGTKGLHEGDTLLGEGIEVQLRQREPSGLWQVRLRSTDEDADLPQTLQRLGQLPLPPYIKRPADAADAQRYQTVFARQPGAVAAPTAGLHFTPDLLQRMTAAGHAWTTLTLHVGPGTFAPLRSDVLEQQRLHAEVFSLPQATAAAIEQARQDQRPVLAVGTTVMRTLESCATEEGRVQPRDGHTELFIRPPFRFRVVDGLLTNFHTPRSSLLALVMAFAGIEATKRAYAIAIEQRYRFFSYGDAMLLLRDGR